MGAAADGARSDVLVIGSGPNGLAGAIVAAQAGYSVKVIEAAPDVGGGTRSAELTLPGFVHDICSAVHPLAVASPFFRSLPLAQHGLEWVYPSAPLAHPLDDGSAVLLERSIAKTAVGLGSDGSTYEELLTPLLHYWDYLLADVLGPIRWPAHPLSLARFGMHAVRSAASVIRSRFRGKRARALFAGLCAHSMLPLHTAGTAAFGLILAGAAHAVSWPFPKGGAQRIADALSSYLQSLGGELVTNCSVESLDQLPSARALLCDVTPRQLLRIAGERLPASYRRKLHRYRYGVGAFKVDWALDGPIPWRAAECSQAGTVHLGGTFDEIVASEEAAWTGSPAQRPFVLLAQPSLFDTTRAPAGKHTAWAYCHVPHGSSFAMLERIEQQVERFAPGFRQLILARSVMSPAALEQHNPNLVGGDINGGVQNLSQMFMRPTRQLYATPTPGLFICSSSTPPGGGVHGMCGYFAAKAALEYLRSR
jgi:phytoene dehydrogenase-like protein